MAANLKTVTNWGKYNPLIGINRFLEDERLQPFFFTLTQRRKGAEVLQVERTQKCIAVDAIAWVRKRWMNGVNARVHSLQNTPRFSFKVVFAVSHAIGLCGLRAAGTRVAFPLLRRPHRRSKDMLWVRPETSRKKSAALRFCVEEKQTTRSLKKSNLNLWLIRGPIRDKFV